MSKIIIESESPVKLKTLLKGALENELRFINIGLKKTVENLRKYETKYHMNSKVFYGKYSSGDAGDDMEYIKWAGELETLKKLESNIKDLTGVEIC